jgi:hypothetical protein
MYVCIYTYTHYMTLLAMSIDHNLHKSYCMIFQILQNSEEVVKLLLSVCLSVCLPQILITCKNMMDTTESRSPKTKARD